MPVLLKSQAQLVIVPVDVEISWKYVVLPKQVESNVKLALFARIGLMVMLVSMVKVHGAVPIVVIVTVYLPDWVTCIESPVAFEMPGPDQL